MAVCSKRPHHQQRIATKPPQQQSSSYQNYNLTAKKILKNYTKRLNRSPSRRQTKLKKRHLNRTNASKPKHPPAATPVRPSDIHHTPPPHRNTHQQPRPSPNPAASEQQDHRQARRQTPPSLWPPYRAPNRPGTRRQPARANRPDVDTDSEIHSEDPWVERTSRGQPYPHRESSKGEDDPNGRDSW
ncbi:hypothetical protein QQ045_027507 [Rhodiola kirilowii]